MINYFVGFILGILAGSWAVALYHHAAKKEQSRYLDMMRAFIEAHEEQYHKANPVHPEE